LDYRPRTTAEAGAISHDDLTGVTPDQHHDQEHTHDGVDGSGVVDHDNLTNVTPDQHHDQSHSTPDHTDFELTDGGGLTLNFAAGVYHIDNLISVLSAGTLVLPDNTSAMHVYLGQSGVAQQLIEFPTESIPLGLVYTSGGVITSIQDRRSWLSGTMLIAHNHSNSHIQGRDLLVSHTDLDDVTANQHHNQAHGATDHDRTVVDPYLIPIEDQFNLTTEFLFRATAILDNGFASFLSSGTVGGGFGNDDGLLSINSGGTATNYATLAIASPTGTARSLALSSTSIHFKIYFDSINAVIQNIKIVGLGSTTTMGTGYQTAGASTGCFFRIDATASAVNWFAVTKDGTGSGNETTTNTGILDRVATSLAADGLTIEIVATSTSVSYYMSLGVNVASPTLIATHTTNIPTAALIALLGTYQKVTIAANKSMEVRWLKFKSARTNVL